LLNKASVLAEQYLNDQLWHSITKTFLLCSTYPHHTPVCSPGVPTEHLFSSWVLLCCAFPRQAPAAAARWRNTASCNYNYAFCSGPVALAAWALPCVQHSPSMCNTRLGFNTSCFGVLWSSGLFVQLVQWLYASSQAVKCRIPINLTRG